MTAPQWLVATKPTDKAWLPPEAFDTEDAAEARGAEIARAGRVAVVYRADVVTP